MSLVTAGTVPAPADLPPIKNNGFWPDVDPAAMRVAHRLDGTVTPQRLYAEMLSAIIECNSILMPWQALKTAAGYRKATDVPLEAWHITGQREELYRQAVYATAHARLIENYSDITATGRANDDLTSKETEADGYRVAAQHAISEIQDAPHCTVELI